MKEKYTVKNICESIWNIEEKMDLLNASIQDVNIWQYIRMDMYYKIAVGTGVLHNPHPIKITYLEKTKAFLNQLMSNSKTNPLSDTYNKDILIFDHPRKIKKDGQYIDPYTHYFVKSLNKESYMVYERPYMAKHFTKYNENIKYLDAMIYGSQIYRFFNRVKYTNEESTFIQSIENEISKVFNINIDLESLFSNRILKFKYEYKYYTKLIEKRKPKQIFVVIAYNNAPLIYAAKKLGVVVIELQHGVLSKYHLGYSYPKCKKDLEYLPDKIYSFGDHWFKKVDIPIDSNNIISIGYEHFRKMKEKFKNVKKEHTILFVSQGVIGKELFRIALELSARLPEKDIIFKLHPSEYKAWKDLYLNDDDFSNMNLNNNLNVIDNNDIDLYELFARAEFQIGVFSTAIYEGLEFGCKTILIELPGIEYMQDLIDNKYVKKANNSEDIKEIINNDRFIDIKQSNEVFF